MQVDNEGQQEHNGGNEFNFKAELVIIVREK